LQVPVSMAQVGQAAKLVRRLNNRTVQPVNARPVLQ
jgi:carbonic anhydrase